MGVFILYNAYPETGDCSLSKSDDVGSPIFHLPTVPAQNCFGSENLPRFWRPPCGVNRISCLACEKRAIDQAVVCVHVICESRRGSLIASYVHPLQSRGVRCLSDHARILGTEGRCNLELVFNETEVAQCCHCNGILGYVCLDKPNLVSSSELEKIFYILS